MSSPTLKLAWSAWVCLYLFFVSAAQMLALISWQAYFVQKCQKVVLKEKVLGIDELKAHRI